MTPKDFLRAIEKLEGTLYEIKITNRFSKSLSLSYRRNLDINLLKDVIYTLAKGEPLDAKYRPHRLKGYAEVIYECHIKPDWLLIWKQQDDDLILILLDTGTHSDLF